MWALGGEHRTLRGWRQSRTESQVFQPCRASQKQTLHSPSQLVQLCQLSPQGAMLGLTGSSSPPVCVTAVLLTWADKASSVLFSRARHRHFWSASPTQSSRPVGLEGDHSSHRSSSLLATNFHLYKVGNNLIWLLDVVFTWKAACYRPSTIFNTQ